MNEITSYDDYRKFLKQRLRFLKEQNPKISYQYLAKKIGSTNSYLKHIAEGRGNIGLDRISKVAKAIKLNRFETQYFTVLVLKGLIKDPVLRESLNEVMARLVFSAAQPELLDFNDKNSTSFPLSYWLYGVIIELMTFKNFKNDPKWIQSHLIDEETVSLVEIKSAIDQLLKKGVIEREGESLKLVQNTNSAVNPFHTEDFKNYRGNFKKTISVLENPGAYRSNAFLVTTIAINSEDIKKLHDAANIFRDSVMKVASETKNPDFIYSVNSAIFNMTKKPE